MTTFVLIPGAGGDGSYWDELVAELARRGHESIAVDIPEDDPALGLPEYAQAVEDAIGDRTSFVLVAHSMGAFTAPVVAQRRAPQALVLVNAMIPLPGETPGDWWGAVDAPAARQANDEAAGRGTDFDLEQHFLHDIPADVKARMYAAGSREPSDTPFGQPCEFDRWPDIPIHVITGDDDRFFPPEFQRRVARERLGLDVDLVRGGHLVAKSNPAGLADLLDGYPA